MIWRMTAYGKRRLEIETSVNFHNKADFIIVKVIGQAVSGSIAMLITCIIVTT